MTGRKSSHYPSQNRAERLFSLLVLGSADNRILAKIKSGGVACFNLRMKCLSRSRSFQTRLLSSVMRSGVVAAPFLVFAFRLVENRRHSAPEFYGELSYIFSLLIAIIAFVPAISANLLSGSDDSTELWFMCCNVLYCESCFRRRNCKRSG